MFGSPELIELLKENGFSEKMRELDDEYNALNIECEPLRANSAATLKFHRGDVRHMQKTAIWTWNLPKQPMEI